MPRSVRPEHHRVPPPLTGAEAAIEGLAILEELPDELGLLLWHSLRNATFWARMPPAARSGLFQPDAATDRQTDLDALSLPSRLDAPLRAIASLLAAPADAEVSVISDACLGIGHWAADEGRFGTAAEFAQAAVALRNDDAKAAYLAGRWARKRGDGARAETWFRYAIAEARQNEDWETYALSHVGIGCLFDGRGSFPQARRVLTRALRASRRYRLRNVEAMALHDLFALAISTRKLQAAERLAAAAVEAYGPGHPRVPVVAQDLAFLWTEHGRFAPAMEVLQRVEPLVSGFPEQLLLTSALARAAAGAGRMDLYESASAAAMTMIPEPEVREGVAPALLNLARGAASAGEWERAGRAAARAESIARSTGEAKVRLAAEAVREEVERHARASQPVQPAEADTMVASQAERQLTEVISGHLAIGTG